MTKTDFKSGFVAVVGRPNVGKSTLVNTLVGEKIAIVSDRPQTTRNRLLGVMSGEGYQMVFVDTPGIHKPRTQLGSYMMQAVQSGLEGIDALLRSRGRVLEFDARAVAAECDAPKSVNIALLGAFAAGESFTQEAWLAAVEACVPPKTIEANRRAFLAGWQLGEKA